ncbi:TPA: hypothetical protein EYO63_06110 [Candidatus Poribacteria bacterium]|nr:hypothetical protein [Candidatus Poribacteria bacterium]
MKGNVWNSVDCLNWNQVSAETPFGVRGYREQIVLLKLDKLDFVECYAWFSASKPDAGNGK